MGDHRTFCRICIAACGMVISVDGDHVTAIGGDASHPLTHGYLCPKGRGLGAFHAAPGRLDGGLVGRGAGRRAVDIEECHADLAATLQRIVAVHGIGSVGVFHGTGGFLDSVGSWATRRLKRSLGTSYTYSTATVDAIAKTLIAEQVGGSPVLIPHIDEVDGRLLLFVGVNPVVSHGHSTMFSNPVDRIRAARARGSVFVLDPRASETALLADRHLAARPGTDHAILAYLIRELTGPSLDVAGLEARATGIDELRAAVAPFDREAVASSTGVHVDDLDALLAATVAAGRLAILTGTGSTMAVPGNITEWLAWALMVVTDSFDQPGGMWFNPGLFTRLDRLDTLPGAAAAAPGSPARPDIPRCGGEWPASLIPDEIEAGRLRALIVVGGNLLMSLPDAARVERALSAIDALVVLDVQHTATTEVATHVFASADQLERPDTLPLEINANAIYQQYTDAVFPATTGRPPMWRTLCRIANGVGLDLLGDNVDPEAVSSESMLARLARGFPIEALREDEIHVEAPATFGWVQSRLPSGRWNLAPGILVEQLRTLSPPPPLAVIPRRPTRRMNTQHYRDGDRPEALIHPNDAKAAGIADGDVIDIASRRGSLRLPARVTTAVSPGAVSIQHGWRDTNVNVLIDPHDLDPHTGMAHLSGTAVTLQPARSRLDGAQG